MASKNSFILCILDVFISAAAGERAAKRSGCDKRKNFLSVLENLGMGPVCCEGFVILLGGAYLESALRFLPLAVRPFLGGGV
jgi:hypothetical protein